MQHLEIPIKELHPELGDRLKKIIALGAQKNEQYVSGWCLAPAGFLITGFANAAANPERAKYLAASGVVGAFAVGALSGVRQRKLFVDSAIPELEELESLIN